MRKFFRHTRRSIGRLLVVDDDLVQRTVIEASVGLARAFNMKVVAEGIETVQTLARVKQTGCDIGQGFLFAPSMDTQQISRWISRRTARSGKMPWAGSPRRRSLA